jgi:hypothetical protein
MKLTKSMFGDLKCKAFGLSNNQMRWNSIIKNAGWYNGAGERIGAGDLNLTDMENIAKSLDPTDVFIVLAEIDAMWDMPSTFDHSAPGKDYVLQKAVWLIGKDVKNGNAIIRVRDNISQPENAEQDNVKYYRFPREDMYKSIGYTPKKIDLSSKPTVKKEAKKTLEEKMKNAVNQLKTLKTTKPTQSISATPPAGSGQYIGGSGTKTVPVPMPANPVPTPTKKMKPIKKVSTKP